MTFGLIGEGVTDQILLEQILIGFLKEEEVLVKPLQPLPNESGGWSQVFHYCESGDFKQALAFNDFLVVQIDTDFMSGPDVPEQYRIELKDLDVEKTVLAFKEKLADLIGEAFFVEYKTQIIFAIAVDEIECWLLPAYFENHKKKAAKTQNCINTLNTVLKQREGFYIEGKKREYYEQLARNFRKRKDILKYAKKNPSFQIFVEELETKVAI